MFSKRRVARASFLSDFCLQHDGEKPCYCIKILEYKMMGKKHAQNTRSGTHRSKFLTSRFILSDNNEVVFDRQREYFGFDLRKKLTHRAGAWRSCIFRVTKNCLLIWFKFSIRSRGDIYLGANIRGRLLRKESKDLRVSSDLSRTYFPITFS